MMHYNQNAFETCKQKVREKTSQSPTEEAILILTALENRAMGQPVESTQSVQTLRKEVLDAIKRMSRNKAKQEYIRRAQNIR